MTEARKCEIAVSKLSRRYYLSFGATRSRDEYKTWKGAVVRAAIRRGCIVVNADNDPMVEFLKADKRTKIVTVLGTDRLVRIAENTPLCCDPSSETYWSM